LLRWAGLNAEVEPIDYLAFRDQEIDRLADALDASLDWQTLNPLLGLASKTSGSRIPADAATTEHS